MKEYLEILVILIKAFLLSWLVRKVIEELYYKYFTYLPSYASRLICVKCVTFWTALIYTQNFFIAVGVSFLSVVLVGLESKDLEV